jgi:hypothetical protein
MKKLALLLVCIGGLLSGCVAYSVPYGDGGAYRGDGRAYRDRDRDGDGIPDRRDRRPDNPYRY